MPLLPTLDAVRASDVRPLADMSRRLIEYGFKWRWTPAATANLLRDPETAGVVARTASKRAGFAIVSYRFEQRSAHLILMAVEPWARGTGVGTALWRWHEKIARQGGIHRIALEVRADNTGALAFYRALGFRDAGTLQGYYEGVEDALRMTLELRRKLSHRS